MNEKYIAKSELDLALENLCKKYNVSYGEESMGFGRELAELSDRLVAANVKLEKHGRWIEEGDIQLCSECGEEHSWQDYRASYCDVCGAKMDGGGQQDNE